MQSRNKTFGMLAAASMALWATPKAFGEEGKSAAATDKTKAAKTAYFCQNNTCKGKSECSGHGGGSGCAGTNDCKGKGWVTATDAKACKAKGGLWKVDKGD